ncbi:hypothetical protein GCM10011494_19360 [Novosphingobium endophyticum]|uniref:Uncharacterized protein n=1 Tax=Novosphingobium endophyticum TaxID=1955250 RepID=A0A916TS57_9SPHN|nr:hypothetical protein GCM10011494_19360 [Novosphingobium endophyticum]
MIIHIEAEGAKTREVSVGVANGQGQLIKMRNLVLGNGVQEFFLGLMMAKERSVVDLGLRADVSNGDLIKGPALQKAEECVLQGARGPQGPRVLRLCR